MRYYLFVFLLMLFLSCENKVILEKTNKWNKEQFESYSYTLDSTSFNQHFKKLLSKNDVTEDFLAFRYVLEKAQTSIYRYSPKDKLDSIFDLELIKIQDGVSYFEFLRSISRVQATIACGHSGWSHHKGYYRYRSDSILLFPFDLKVKNERVFIHHNNSLNTNMKVGSELLSLNGSSINNVIDLLKIHMVQDGTSAPNSFSGIENSFSNAFSNFIGNPKSFKLELRNADGKIFLFETKGELKATIDSLRKSRYDANEGFGVPLRFNSIDSLQTAVYTIKWFRNEYIAAQNQDFLRYTDSIFDVVKKLDLKNLIIDLRGNVGGWTANGKYLFSYFINDTLPYIKRVETKLVDFKQFDPMVLNYPAYPDSATFKKNNTGLYEWKNYPSLFAIPQDTNRFKGKVFILIDDLTRSCSSVFTNLMKEHTNVVVVGEENGATQCGSNAMVMAFKLPNSGITIFISTAKYTSAISDTLNSRGVTPNFILDHSEIPNALEKLLTKIEKENNR